MARDIITPEVPIQPLVLKARGSFYVGGERVHQSELECGRPGMAGHVVVNQMYVECMVPQSAAGHAPVVMVHGTTQSGKTYDTTPDGRMGWYEYFVRRGHPVYVVDQVSRGRSGFNQALFNQVRAGIKPPQALPNISRFNEEFAWVSMRLGPAWGVPFSDSRFPVGSAFELSRQNIPDLNASLPSPLSTWQALAALALKLEGVVLMGHSQSGAFPLDAALIEPASVRGMILVEPGSQGAKSGVYTDREIATLARIPTLIVFGDHLDVDTGQPHAPRLWQQSFDDCLHFIDRVSAFGGNAHMLHLPSLGILGNCHMLMQDINNLEIADLILAWMSQHVA